MSRTAAAAPWQRRIVAAVLGALVGLAVALGADRLPALVSIAGLALGLVSGSCLLAWAADLAEIVAPGRIVLTVVALAGVLPELTIEVQLAYRQQTGFVTANLTGATRLLLAVAMALPAFGRPRDAFGGGAPGTVRIGAGPRVELAVLAVAVGVGVTIVATGEFRLVHGVIFAALYALWFSRSGVSSEAIAAVAGVPGGVAALGPTTARWICGGMFIAAAAVVLLTARPFPDALVRGGTAYGVDPYLLIQYVVPFATETPELVVAGAFVRNRRPDRAVALLLAASVTQWTLALGAVSVAFLLGGGGGTLTLSGRERVELLLTMSTTLLAVAGLMSLELERVDAWVMVFGFGLQAVFISPDVRLAIGASLAIFAVAVLIDRRRLLPATLATLARSTVAEGPPSAAGARDRR